MRSLTDASVNAQERRVIERLLELLEAELGPQLRAVCAGGDG
jgi:hypothetical protein